MISEKLFPGDGTIFLSVKNTHITAMLKYIEHRTPKREENLRALAFLGIDIGNITPNEKIAADKMLPVLLSPRMFNKF